MRAFGRTNKIALIRVSELSGRNMWFSEGGGGYGKKLWEIAGGLQGSRIKNASQLSQENCKGMDKTWGCDLGNQPGSREP